MSLFLNIFLLGIIIGTHSARVLDLTDSFLEERKDGGYWLVKFYAPWCGHCKKLEPEWAQVSQALARSNIKVRRIDCSRFPSIASEFAIRGYPTIKFITKNDDFTFNGDRNKEDIVNFAIRMAGPVIQEITQPENLVYIKNVLKPSFFMYVGDQKGSLWENYKQAASKWQPYCYFYWTNEHIAKQHLEIPEVPMVLIYKENTTYYFEVNKYDGNEKLNISLSNWINEERFESFPKITRGNINEILQTNKYIVFVVVDEDKFQQIPSEMLKFMNKVLSLVKNYRDKYHKNFQFGWVGNPNLANSIAMEILPLPYLLVLNSTNYYHYVPDDEISKMTVEAIDVFLDGIYNQTVQPRGGNGFLTRIYRTYFDASTAIADMWGGNPILITVLFGIPCILMSCILYAICCGEIADIEDEEEDMHPKKE